MTATKDIKKVEEHREVFNCRVDIYEHAADIVLVADIPGVKEKDLEVTLEKNELTIHGKSIDEVQTDGLVHAEYRVGDYLRVFTVNTEEIDTGKIKAKVSNGVLKLVLPKAEQSKARKIEIARA